MLVMGYSQRCGEDQRYGGPSTVRPPMVAYKTNFGAIGTEMKEKEFGIWPETVFLTKRAKFGHNWTKSVF